MTGELEAAGNQPLVVILHLSPSTELFISGEAPLGPAGPSYEILTLVLAVHLSTLDVKWLLKAYFPIKLHLPRDISTKATTAAKPCPTMTWNDDDGLIKFPLPSAATPDSGRRTLAGGWFGCLHGDWVLH